MMKAKIFLIIAVILSDIMCAHVGYEYMRMTCGMRHLHWSGGPDLAFIYAVPYLTGILICLVLARKFRKK